jgi:hypothetical protein
VTRKQECPYQVISIENSGLKNNYNIAENSNSYNNSVIPLDLEKRVSLQANITDIEEGWRLGLEANENRSYRLAQLDNYGRLSRGAFPYKPPIHISLRARASQNNLPGTWGFGLWNDPFGFSLGFGATAMRLPALPNAAWFFFASPENYLAFDDDLPANGAMASVYKAPHIPSLFLAFNLPLLPLLAWAPGTRWLRRRMGQFIRQDTKSLTSDQTIWHDYEINWQKHSVIFSIDGKDVLETKVSPLPPLGLVIWIDNQYAAWPPDGRPRYGILPTLRDFWVEIKDLHLD